MREAPAPDVGRVVEERAAVGRELDVVQVVRRRRPREVRARVGMLEDVRGAAGDGLGSALRDDEAWARFT